MVPLVILLFVMGSPIDEDLMVPLVILLVVILLPPVVSCSESQA